jgi:hypothetical protein
MNNPFRKFLQQEPPVLVGRDYLIESFLEGASRPRQPDSFQLTALRTMGATTLLRALAHQNGVLNQRHYTQWVMPPYNHKEGLILIYLDFVRYDSPAGIAAWIYEQTKVEERLQAYWGNETESDPARRLRRMLIQADEDHKRVVWLCDHFDRVFERVEAEQATALRPLVSLASFITATEEPLTELNRDAAASLFSGQLIPCNLNPLTPTEARALLQKVIPQNAKDLHEYRQLLPWTGHHPYFILRGCEQWYDIREKRRSISVDLLLELAQDNLLNLFRPDFVRFWNHVKPEQDLLIQLVKSGFDDQVHRDLGSIDRLVDKGLVTLDRGTYQPFSKLWAKFVREEAQTREIIQAAQPTTKAPKLTGQEQDLLQALMKRPGQICGYAEMIEVVWPGEEDTPENRHRLRQVALRLRRKLKGTPDHAGNCAIIGMRDTSGGCYVETPLRQHIFDEDPLFS